MIDIRPRGGTALLYHDVVPEDGTNRSGNLTDGSWRFKLTTERFRRHIEAIDEHPAPVVDVREHTEERATVLTFDDGGRSAIERIAPILEENGMMGHFFVITGRIGDDRYMTKEQVRELVDRGHHVGSHTVSHPNLVEFSRENRLRELRESKETVERITGRRCRLLSIPGGFCNETVIADAHHVGYEYVFTSRPEDFAPPAELPTSVGRWNVWWDTDHEAIEGILRGNSGSRLLIQLRWLGLEGAKDVLGQPLYERVKRRLIATDT